MIQEAEVEARIVRDQRRILNEGEQFLGALAESGLVRQEDIGQPVDRLSLARHRPPGIKVSVIWLTGMYALHTWGELCISPIGLALVNKLAPLKFASLLMAVWFLSNAAGNKLAGVLSTLYPDNGRTTTFLGYEMNNMYDFFMLFVFVSGIASIILFFLSRKLKRVMRNIS